MLKGIDINSLLDAIYIVGSIIIALGMKMKWWKQSDFSIAREITLDALKDGLGHVEIASKISNVTKLTDKQALLEVRETVSDLRGDEKPLAKRVQRAGRKLIWRLLDGGL